ncbi:hypothetical protein CHS0354_027159 [Potamilus streckersoni]|uniref:DNA2/NAM7 helicase-like C-terminal domain-containing protein n=1 Tax=Potamilus streckersoni TaxID=2493646 RepID=A0AAE0WE87_9BIVA|nr:hypothetical protein CHS0354_027159 [Potamilus streckersoni]
MPTLNVNRGPPTAASYSVCVRIGEEVSSGYFFFERLVKNRINCVTLLEQHRMRPEISVLVRHIYPDLRVHSLVRQYGDAKGFKRNIFFIEHMKEESYNGESRSYSNEYEAKFIAALAKHLLKQGYMRPQITILTPYIGQIGFYVIGNFPLLLKYSDQWRKIVTSLQDTHAIGSQLGCQVHGTGINVACEEDFNKSPNGGCGLPCSTELSNQNASIDVNDTLMS